MRAFLLIGLFLLMSVGSLFAGGASEGGGGGGGAAPAWMRDIDEVYPDRDFVAVRSSGDSRKLAEENARADLARRFRVNIKATFEGEERYQQLVSGGQIRSESMNTTASNRVSSTTDQSLSNIKYSEPFTDRTGAVNIVAFINRKEATEQYRRLLGEDFKAINNFKDRFGKTDGAMLKFALMDAALLVADHAETLLAQLDIINQNEARQLSSQLRKGEILELRDQAASQVRVRLEIAGDADGKIAGIVSKMLQDIKLTTANDGPISVVGEVSYDNNAARNASRSGVRWTLALRLADESGKELAAMFKEQLEEAISLREAQAFAIQEIEKAIKREFSQRISQYLINAAMGK